MTEAELYKTLGVLTKQKERWEENIPYVASLLSSDTTKIKAKALWLLGEMGLAFPDAIKGYVSVIATFLDSNEPLLCDGRCVEYLAAVASQFGAEQDLPYAVVYGFVLPGCQSGVQPQPQ